MSSELRLRIISGVVLGVLVLATIWAGGLWFRALATLIMVLMHYEFSTIVGAPRKAPLANAIGWLAVIAAGVFIMTSLPAMALAAIAIGAAGAAFSGLRSSAGVWSATAVLYAGFSGLALAEIRGEGLFGLFAMLFVIAIVWSTDTLAYFCGRVAGWPQACAAYIAWQDLVRGHLRRSSRCSCRHRGGACDPPGRRLAGAAGRACPVRRVATW
jgi:phosphatidate cytidylyltransferase